MKRFAFLRFLCFILSLIFVLAPFAYAENQSGNKNKHDENFFEEDDFISEEEEDRIINEINRVNEEKGVAWRAGKTSVSRLSVKGMRKLMGDISASPSPNAPKLGIAPATAQTILQAGSDFDWGSSYTGYKYVTPARPGIWDSQGWSYGQYTCGSCWAWATTAALESQVLIDYDRQYSDLDLSEQALLSCSGAGNCTKGNIELASYYLVTTGLPKEGCYAYQGTMGSCSNVKADCGDGFLRSDRFKINGYNYVYSIDPDGNNKPPDLATVKAALKTWGPLVTTMPVYQDLQYFQRNSTSADPNMVYTHTWGSYVGEHAVLITGFNEGGQYLIVKNSWGSIKRPKDQYDPPCPACTSWGYYGFFKFAYSDATKGGIYCDLLHSLGCTTISYGRAIKPAKY